MHFHDNFLTLGAPNTIECSQNLKVIMQLFGALNIPIAENKIEGSSTQLPFLGLLDTVNPEARLQIGTIREAILCWLSKSITTKCDILSFIGLLSFAAKVVPPSWTFL